MDNLLKDHRCPSVSTFHFELSTPQGSSHEGPHQFSYQCHSAPLIRPLFSCSYALFCPAQIAISHLFFSLPTLCTNHPGGGHLPPARNLLSASLPPPPSTPSPCGSQLTRQRLHPTLYPAPVHCYSFTNAEDPARTIPSSLGGQAGSPRGQERFRFPTHQITKASQT